MNEPEPVVGIINLGPGEIVLSRKPAILATILGSCIGITFWYRRLGAGALCHAVLPRVPGADADGACAATGCRYVDFCIRTLAQRFDSMGARRQEVEVKVFGGADVIGSGRHDTKASVGRLNAETAMEVLAEEGYEVAASSVGCTFGRKILFHTGSGEVHLMRLT